MRIEVFLIGVLILALCAVYNGVSALAAPPADLPWFALLQLVGGGAMVGTTLRKLRRLGS